jgi:valyl-tRNA synthetase
VYGGDRRRRAHGETAAHQVLADGSEVIVPLAGTIDVAKECARLQQELAGLEKQLGGLRQRLANENFVSRAKARDRRGRAPERT